MIPLSSLKDRDRVLLVEAGRLHPAVTFTRATIATSMNGVGKIVTAAVNQPRFEYNSAGVYLGLLIEETRSNRALRSRDMTNATWVKSNITTAQTAIGLDGIANSATKLTATAANATSLQTITDATSRARVVSFDIKRITGTGTVNITADNGSTWTAVSGLSSSLFTRYSVLVTNANPVIGVRIVTNGDEIVIDYVQCEDGSFATSRIATTTAAVTRNPDIATIPFASIGFNTSAGTIFTEYDIGWTAAGSTRYVSAIDQNGRFAYTAGANVMSIYDGATVVGSGVSIPVNTLTKTASSFGSNGLAICTNGGTVVTGAYDGTFGAITTLAIGCVSGGGQICGHIKRQIYYPRQLLNTDMQRLST